MVAAIKQNFPQREIADASFRYQQEVDSKQRIVVGVNDYVLEDDEQIPILRIDPELERKQKGRVEATKTRRDIGEVERTLDALKAAAATDANLMPPILDCARARVSEGEMVEALQAVFGSYTELPVF
jgi:methylmalonyl-CoA mutase N-terminal domain/subunit